MKKHCNQKILAAAVILVAFGLYAKTPLTRTFFSFAQANDEEDAASSRQDQKSDENKDSGSSDSAKKANEVQKEAAKKVGEIQRESAKKAFEIQKESASKKLELLKKSQEITRKVGNNGQGNSVKSNDSTDNNNETEDSNDIVSDDANEVKDGIGLTIEESDALNQMNASERSKHAAEKIAEAEKYILKQQSEGKDVTIALERLAQAKNMLNASASLVSNASSGDTADTETSDDLIKESLKMAHTAREDDVHTINDADKFIKKASERIDQATRKLAQLSAINTDTAQYQIMIDTATADLKSAQGLLLQGSLLDGANLAQKSESEAKTAKKTIESALLALGVDDEELSGDHKSVVAKAVEDLLFVADVEGENGVGTKVREIAHAQRDSADKVDTLIDDAQSRSHFAEFLLGPKYTDLNNIQKQITDNASRIQSLTQVKSQLTDTDLQGVVQEHIDALTEENTKLQAFISGKELKKGVFGWVFRLLQQ